MRKAIILMMLLMFLGRIQISAQIRSDFLIYSDGSSPFFEFDSNNNIHLVWEGASCKYSSLNDSGSFIVPPKPITDSTVGNGMPLYSAKPTLSIHNKNVACVWERINQQLTNFSTYIKSIILNDEGEEITDELYLDDHEYFASDTPRKTPVIIWNNDTSFYCVWAGIGSRVFNSANTFDIYYKKVFINPFTIMPSPMDKIITNGRINQHELRPSIIKKKNNEGYLILICEEDSLGYWNVSGLSLDDTMKINAPKIIYREKVKTSWMSKPRILQKQNSNYIVVWEEDKTDTSANIYFREFTEEGVALTQAIKANDSQAFAATEISAAIDSNDNFIIVWEDGANLKAQRFYSDLSKKGTVFQINTINASGSVVNIYPHVRLHGGKIFTAWEKSDRGNSSIWMNILDFDNPVNVSETAESPSNFVLYQNYPNPFNPSTTIKYSVPGNEKRETKNVKLTVYDVLGNEVATLVNEQKPAGNYEVKFDGSRLSSGIYFYQLKSGNFSETKKMILMK